ncbi:MAG: alpha-amylase family glycosyl hydrolase [Bacteroidota bacterium]
MKRTLLLVITTLICQVSMAQVVTVSPTLPTVDDEITLTFDVTQSTDDRAQGLLGLTDDVFLWSGAGDESEAFIYGPDGQNNFGVAFEPGRMTSIGNDRWQITLTPRSYYGIPDGTRVTRLGLLLKNEDGTAQTEDVFIDIDPGNFITLTSPSDPNSVNFVTQGQEVTITAEASSAGDMEMFINNMSVASVTNATTIQSTYTVNMNETVSVRVTGMIAGDDVEINRDIEFFIAQDNVIEALPAGLQLGINYDDTDQTKVTLVLQAPFRTRCYVVGDFTNFELSNDYQMKRDPDNETYWLEITGLTPGQEYIFQYWVDGTIKIGDPYADKVADPWNDEFIPDSVYPNLIEYTRTENEIATTFQTGQTPFAWAASEDTWVKPDKEDLVVYELLVRDFVGSHDYKDLIDSLDYLQRLGVNAIELMPIMEFEGNSSWGYNPSYAIAPDKYYGTKNDLKTFIQIAHQKGFAVILDMVLNHHFGQSPLARIHFNFDLFKPTGLNPWFNIDATHPFNVGYDFDHESQYTRDYMDSVNTYWIEEYHFDGFRFDLSKGFTQNQGKDPGDVGAWGQFDQSRIDILTRMAEVIWESDPTAYVILEHFADGSEEQVLADEGMLLWGNLNFAFRPLISGQTPSATIFNMDNRAYVNYMESHDEERLMYENMVSGASEGDYDVMNLEIGLNRVKMASAFFFLTPGPKMLWQFQELGYDIDINFNGRTGEKPLVWGDGSLGYYDDPERQKLYATTAGILKIRNDFPQVINEGTYNFSQTGQTKRINIAHADMDIVIIGNFGLEENEIDPNFSQTGEWHDYFFDSTFTVTNTSEMINLSPGEFRIYTTQQLESPGTDLVSVFPKENQDGDDDDDDVVGLNNEELARFVNVYPNPSEGFVIVEFGTELGSTAEITIYDVIGNPVIRKDFGKFGVNEEVRINTADLTNGLYMIDIAGENGHVIKRLFVNN